MSKNSVQDTVKSLCKLYKGGDSNPYQPGDLKGSEGKKQYLKFNIWDAEYSVTTKYYTWLEIWKASDLYQPGLSKADQAEEVYKLAVMDKLKKMERPDIDFMKMYFEL